MSAYLDAARELLSRRSELKLLSATKLHAVLRKEGAPITKKQTEQLLREEAPAEQGVADTYRVRKRAKKYYRITAVPYSFQIDILKFPAYKKKNKGADGILAIIEILSRKAWAYPLKGNAMKDVLTKFKGFVADLAPITPAFVQGDNEFAAKLFKEYSESEGFVLRTNVAAADHRVPGGGDALGVIDRFARTIRELLTRKMLAEDSTEWTKFLPAVLAAYNSSPHAAHKSAGELSSSGAGSQPSPNDVYSDFDEMMARRLEDLMFNRELYDEKSARSDALKVGHWVRIVQTKGKFEKGRARLGVDRYKIVATKGPGRFMLEGTDGEKLKRAYKDAELTRTQPPSAPPKPSAVAEAQREHTNTLRFKRVSGLPQDPTEPAQLAAPRQTRLKTGAIAQKKYTR